jgi:hypothetical protein
VRAVLVLQYRSAIGDDDDALLVVPIVGKAVNDTPPAGVREYIVVWSTGRSGQAADVQDVGRDLGVTRLIGRPSGAR